MLIPVDKSELSAGWSSCKSESGGNGHCPAFAGLDDGHGGTNGLISEWNVSKVTDMSAMFSYATAFDANLSAWNTGAVTKMGGMFNDAKAFKGTGGLAKWNVSQVTKMGWMFNGAAALASKPLWYRE